MAESRPVSRFDRMFRLLQEDAQLVAGMLEIGDQRLLAGDGPVNGRLPDLSPSEWGKVYRACKRIAKRLA